MTDTFNANLVSIFIHKCFWKHPNKNEIYWFTNGNYDFLLAKSTEHLLANIYRPHETEAILYKIYDKIIDNKKIPFITIGIQEYEIVELVFGASDDKLVLKTSENVELVFLPQPLGTQPLHQ
jgi:hypothetical protein